MSDLFQFRYTTLPAPVQWGIMNEDRAREEYLSMKNLIESTTVTKTGLTLCSSHSFLCASLPWCDFALWTAAERNNIFIERVLFNCDFVKDMMPALVEFYVNKVLPNIVKI